MTSYSNIYDAFNNNEYDELDKMAREYNNKDKIFKKLNEKNNSQKFNFFNAQGNFTNSDYVDYLNKNYYYKNSDSKNLDYNCPDSIEGVSNDLSKYSLKLDSINHSQYGDQDSRNSLEDSFLLNLKNNKSDSSDYSK